MAKSLKIVTIGGGTGSATLLRDLKDTTTELAAIVNMSDDGGSTGLLRREMGVMPPGDIRQCLFSLSEDRELREMFGFRFGEGSFVGQSLGNLILGVLEHQSNGDLLKTIETASRMLKVKGKVIPVTLDKNDVLMRDGRKAILGEYVVGHRPIKFPYATISLEPEATISPGAAAALANAELIILAPGNFYGSLLPTLVVKGMNEALKSATAKKIMVTNLLTKTGQTDGWHVMDYVREVEKHTFPGVLDAVLYNTKLPTKGLLKTYALPGELPVSIEPKRFKESNIESFGYDLLSDEKFLQDRKDQAIRRTILRHDGKKVTKALKRILSK